MRCFPILCVLSGCGNPISNAVLYEDEAFLAALPTDARLASPTDLRVARVGDSVLLGQAVGAAATLDDFMAPLAAIGEILRKTTPDDRAEVRRAWGPTAAAVTLNGELLNWWSQAELIRPLDTTTVQWTVEIAGSADGPWVVMASGEHDADGVGNLTYEIGEFVTLLQAQVPGTEQELPDRFHLETIDAGDARARELVVEEPGALALGAAWHVAAESTMAWFDDFELTEDGLAWPGTGQAHHQPDVGGRAFGALFTADGELLFEVCWDANGDDTYVQGDGFPEHGVVSDCLVEMPVAR
jgi:hypothetical protein